VDDVWQLVRWAHLIAMAFFVGGQLVVAAAVVPATRGEPDNRVIRAIARRFAWGSAVAGLVLLGTGIAMADRFQQWDNPTLHTKLGLVAGVVALLVWHVRRPTWHALAAATFLLSLVIVWLGLSLAHG
jgi:uncharacterized membrane protein